MRFLISLVFNILLALLISYVLPGFKINNFIQGLLVAFILGLINSIIRPLLLVLNLPINFYTQVIPSFFLMLLNLPALSSVTYGYSINSFWWIVLFSIIMSLLSWLLQCVIPKKYEL